MYGKHFESMYTGSMIGIGAVVFAVWGYVIANRRKDLVELNPELLAFLLGESKDEVVGAIERLCAPDPKSRTKEEDGRRLIKEGEYVYRVVNAVRYDEEANEYERRERDKFRKREERASAGECSTKNNGTKHDLWREAVTIYDLYPRKVGKKSAVQKIAAAIKEFGLEKVLEATKTYAQAWSGASDLQFCPHPATWFGGHRFNDDPSTWMRKEGKKTPESNQIQETIPIKTL